MKPIINHSWTLSPREAIALQKELAVQVRIEVPASSLRFIAGVDCALSTDQQAYLAIVVIFDRLKQQVIETHTGQAPLSFPYIPGLLSFREIPAILQAFNSLDLRPDAIMVDGHGIAHPRAFGIACHLGVLFDLPTLGCGKSLLYGHYDEPLQIQGAMSVLYSPKGQVIGKVVRTRAKVKPVIVSIGHRLDLDTAVDLVLSCNHGYRLPEPTRQADRLVARFKASSLSKLGD